LGYRCYAAALALTASVGSAFVERYCLGDGDAPQGSPPAWMVFGSLHISTSDCGIIFTGGALLVDHDASCDDDSK
jgi:hypothetical protein